MSGRAERFAIQAAGFGGFPAVWVKGGFHGRNTRAGSATIVATADGGKPRALYVRQTEKYHQDKHALVPAEKGHYIINAAYAFPSNWTIRIYRIVAMYSRCTDGVAGVDALLVFKGTQDDECPLVELEDAIDEACKKAVGGSAVLPYVQDDVTAKEWFARFESLLLPLDKQLDVLSYYNSKYWGGFFTADELAAVNTTSSHRQRVHRLEVLHPSFGSAAWDVVMWGAVFAGEYGSIHLGSPLKEGLSHLRYRDGTRQYGSRQICRSLIDLAGLWEPQRGPGPIGVLKGSFAGPEVLAAYALHPELLDEMDGYELPNAHMLGFDLGGQWLTLEAYAHDTDGELSIDLSNSGAATFELEPDRAYPLVLC